MPSTLPGVGPFHHVPCANRLADHELPGIHYYSGTAEYTKTFHFSPVVKGAKMLLDLGVSHHLAEITCKGKRLGVLWTAPWRIDLTEAVQSGENKLQIAVTNVWANRLIEDEQQPPDWYWEYGDPEIKSGQLMKALPKWFLEGKPRHLRNATPSQPGITSLQNRLSSPQDCWGPCAS